MENIERFVEAHMNWPIWAYQRPIHLPPPPQPPPAPTPHLAMQVLTSKDGGAKAVLKAARSSMGAEISPIDLVSFSRMCLFLVVGWRGRGNQGFSLNLCSHVQLQPH